MEGTQTRTERSSSFDRSRGENTPSERPERRDLKAAGTAVEGIAERPPAMHVRLLLLQHSQDEIERQLLELSNAGFHVEHEAAGNRQQFREKILQGTYDAVLSDFRLPRWTGLAAFDEMRGLGIEIPFLLVAGPLDEESAAQCHERGLHNYALKEHLSRLPVALEKALHEKSLRDAHGRAAEALHESEASFRMLFAESPLPMWVYDRETLEFLEVNNAAVEHYGYSHEEFLSMRLTGICPAEDVPALTAWRAEHPGAISHAGPWRHRLKNGQLIEAEISQRWLPFAGRDAALVVVMNINERERAEEALRESEARARAQFAELDLLYRTAPIGFAIFDSEFHFVRINDLLAIANGSSPRDYLGHTVRDVLPDLADQIEGEIRRVFESGEFVSNIEVRGEAPSQPGVERCWLTSFYPLRSPGGAVFAAGAVLLEITERKRTEQALLASEARNRELVENTTYAIVRATADGHFLDLNPAMVLMLGFGTAAELRSVNLVRDVFRYPEHYAAFLASCREKGRIAGIEAEWRRKDGANITVRLSGRLVEAQKSPEVLEVIAEDVTELRAVEKQLRQAQKFEAVGQLAGGVAHDFNNVMGAILGWAEMGLEQTQDQPRVMERFARIREQAERAAALTRELLAFARQQVLQPRAIDLNSIVRGLLSFLDKVIGRDIELKVTASPSVGLVRADATQIEQVLMNLCLNARDAMPEGGRLLIETESAEIDEAYCRLYPYSKPGPYTVLGVSDTGIGMDAATRERIFEPFFTTKKLGEGTGLGLATVYGIVRQHGGFIQVYSEPGHGSLFRVYLPAVADRITHANKKKAKINAAPIPRGTETILLAEDHDGVREMAWQALSNLGYRVLTANNGEEVLKLCENEKPALAVLDVIMPKLNGPAVFSRLRERFPTLPAIFTTGYTTEHVSLEKHVQDGSAVLQKPYSPTVLARLVREVLDRAGRPQTQSPTDPAA